MLTAESAHQFLRSRRTVRRFTAEALPEEALTRILGTAVHAPNAHNRQSWRFVRLASSAARAALADAMGAEFQANLLKEGLPPQDAEAQVARSRARILEAPETLLLCLDTAELDTYKDPARSEGEVLMAMQSAALAGGQMLLAAHAEGFGGVWVCAPLFAQAAVRTALALPATWLAQGLILLGRPAAVPAPRPRKPLNEILLVR